MRDNWIRVVLVEDQENFRVSMEAELTLSRGIEVVGAFETFEGAYRALPRLAADVVLMDIGLPGKDGIEGCEILKKRWPRLKVLAFTVEDGQRILAALAAGIDGYLLKYKTTRHELANQIREVYCGKFPMSDDVREAMVHYLRIKAQHFTRLSPMERRVLGEIERGRAQKQIADDFKISAHTVKTYVRRIHEKLATCSSVEAVHITKLAC